MKTVEKSFEDQVYTEKRDALVPQAEAFADAECGLMPARGELNEEHSARWNKSFHSAINRMAREKGLLN